MNEQSKIVAGLLAILRGVTASTSFNLGNNKMRIIYLLCTIAG